MHIIFKRLFWGMFLNMIPIGLSAQILVLDNSIYRIDSTTNYTPVRTIGSFDFRSHHIFELQDKIVALNRSSGLVYEVQKDSVVKIDRSYDDKIHNGSLNFVYNDTLFRFGGYGYFQLNKNLIYYDFPTKQWDLIQFKNYRTIEDFASVSIHFIVDDQLYVLGYAGENETVQNALEWKNRGFVLDLKSKEISNTFKLHESFAPPDCYVETKTGHVFLFYRKDRKLLVIDKKNLRLYSYVINQEESSISNRESDNFVVKSESIFFVGTDIFRNQKIIQMDVNKVLDNMVPLDESLFDKPMDRYRWGLFGCIFIVIILLVYFKRLRKSSTPLTLEGGHLKYGKLKIELDPKAERLMELILEKKTVSNKELNDLFYKKGQNMIHINREKNNCVERINLLFEMKTKRQLILKKQSLYDKRMNVFQLNKKL